MKIKIVASLALGMMLAVSGCGTGHDRPDDSHETVTVQTEKGEVEILANPQRIADISGVSDILYILGHKPVATADADAYNLTEFPTYLAEVLNGARIVGYSMSETVDIEGVLASEPDLIIINPRQEQVYDQLSQIATTIVINPDVNDWRSDLRMVAEMFGKEEEAEAYISDYEAKAAEVGAAIKATNGDQATYYAFLAGDDIHFLFTGAAYGDIFYNDMGLAMPENLPEQDSIELPMVDLEALTEIESDYIFILASDEQRAEFESSSVFNSMEAVQNGNVIWVSLSPYFNQAYSTYGKYQLLDELQELLIR